MKKLLITHEGRFHQKYQSWLNKYRVKKEFLMLIEIGIIFIAVMFCLCTFFIFVNRSSTQGYFLRSAKTTYNDVVFDNEIVTTNIIDLKKINWDKLKENNSSTLLGTNMETIIIDG